MKHDDCAHCYCKRPFIGDKEHYECCMCGHRCILSERIERLEHQYRFGS